MDTHPKAARLAVFLQRLFDAQACADGETAFQLLCATLTAVEDELTDIPNDPSAWLTDGRLYPPQKDSIVASPYKDCTRYRSRRHYVDISRGGAIRISDVKTGNVALEKPGVDGKKVGA